MFESSERMMILMVISWYFSFHSLYHVLVVPKEKWEAPVGTYRVGQTVLDPVVGFVPY